MHRHASVCNVFTVSSPSSSPVDPGTDPGAPEYDYIDDVVDLRGPSAGLGTYQRRRGGRNNKYIANRCMTMHDKANSGARCALTQY